MKRKQALLFSPTFEGRGDGVHICPVTGESVTEKPFLRRIILAVPFIFVAKSVKKVLSVILENMSNQCSQSRWQL
jgi:hypothetical protein